MAGVVRSLRHVVTGLEEQDSANQMVDEAMGDSSLVQLKFYEVIMLLFERECAPEGAIMFARAALQQLRIASASTSLPQGNEHKHKLKRLEGRLWTNIFTYSCDLGNFEGAYAAVVANPLPGHALDCLRRLVHELCERNQLVVLNTLPYAGTLTYPAPDHDRYSPQMAPLIQEVVQALQRRAINSDLQTSPQPYHILHDFLVNRSDFQGAAQAMLALARRLRREGLPDAASQALTAYGRISPLFI